METMLLRSITAITAGALFVAFAGGPARAADPVFPPASRIGLTPPAGLVLSKEFNGFENREKKTAILIVELPPEAYAEIEKGAALDMLKTSGMKVNSNDPFPLKSGPAFLVTGTQSGEGLTVRKWVLVASAPNVTAAVTVQVPEGEQEAYPDAAIRDALSSLTIRANVPAEEQLSVLPFTLHDLAGFRPVRVMAGTAALLTEGPKDAIELAEQPLILITVAAGAPVEPGERDRFARTMFSGTPAIKDVRYVRAEPQRINGQPGYEILASAKDMKTDTDITVVQWLRFGTGGHMRMLGVSRKDAWAGIFPRFRTVRDGIEAK